LPGSRFGEDGARLLHNAAAFAGRMVKDANHRHLNQRLDQIIVSIYGPLDQALH